MVKITEAAGHSLVTPGKQSPDGMKEWSYTSPIVKLVMEKLAQYEGVLQKRLDDPTGKVDYSLSKRTNDANAFGTEMHFDFHLNAYGTGWTSPGGTDTFIHPEAPSDVRALAQKIQTNLVSALGFANRGVKTANFHMCREIRNKRGILMELAFMTNYNEAMKMRTPEYQEKAANAVVNAIVEFYELKKKVINGWQQKDGKWFYYINGVLHKGWLSYKDKWYYLNPTTFAMETGWIEYKGNRFYLDAVNGEMKVGWCKINSKWHYFNKDGDMRVGWFQEGDKWYYLHLSTGEMLTGWMCIGGKWYFFDSTGKMASNIDVAVKSVKVNADGSISSIN